MKKGLKLLRGEVIGAYPARRDPEITLKIFLSLCSFGEAEPDLVFFKRHKHSVRLPNDS